MATLTTSWQNVASWRWNVPGYTGAYVDFYLGAKYSTQSTVNNTTTIQTRLTSTVSYSGIYGQGYNFTCSYAPTVSGTGTWTFTNETITSGSSTITHNADGTKSLTLNAFVSNTSWGLSHTLSASVTLPKINRYGITNSVEGSDIEGDFKVNYIKYVDSYNYKLRISIPSVVMLERIDYNTSGVSFQLSSNSIQELYTRMSSNSISLGFAIETWDSAGTTKLSDGNEKIITAILTNANPIFSNFEFEDVNPVTLALTGDSSINVNGYSNIKATISTSNKATSQKGSTMIKYQFRAGSSNPLDISYSSDSEVSGIINGSTSGVYNIYAIDSRQNSTLVTKLASSEIAYQPLYIDKQSCSFIRNDNQVGENGVLTLNGTIWNDSFGDVTNSITSVTYKFKKTSDSQWINGTTTIIPTITNNNFTFTGQIASDNLDTTWDLDASYNIEVTIYDELSSSTIDLILNSAIPTMSLDKKGVGIMCGYDENIGGPLQLPFEGEQINVLDYYNSKLIASYEFESANNSYTFNDLHLVPNKIYKFKVVGASSTAENINLTINNITSTYYQQCWYTSGTNTSSDANFTMTCIYRPNKGNFYTGMGMTPQTSVVEGTIQLINNPTYNKNYPVVSWKAYSLWSGYQRKASAEGVVGTEVNEITSLTFAMGNNYNFKVGTKIQIIEVRNGLTI